MSLHNQNARQMKSRLVPLLSIFLIAAGCSKDGSTSPEPDLVLHAPTELTTNRVGKTVVRLAWKDNSEAEEGFVVERRNGQGLFTPRLFTARDISTAIDSVGLMPDSTYSYRVHAIRYSERGDFSNVVSIRLTMPFP